MKYNLLIDDRPLILILMMMMYKIINVAVSSMISFFSALSIFWKLHIYVFIDQLASMLIQAFYPGLNILFESGPIRTQVCLHTERPVKQTNKQTTSPSSLKFS